MDNLANKYRPKSWAEVVGQPSIISILSRQVTMKIFKQAYLFVGKAGCGKTSVARIMANSLNNDCGDIIEIDAASNNGIDSIRALINDAQQSPIDCDYKVYVIDECHQLTRAAWDAALKLIEEPPTTAIFIFCTTNPNKIPETIMSRMQRFDFKAVDYTTIADRLEYICNEELDVVYERVALERLAIMANGCVRAAIQMLGQCLDSGNALNLDCVENTLGVVKYDYLMQISNSIINSDLVASLNVLNLIKSTSSNMLQVYDQILEFMVEYLIYIKTNNKNYSKIPNDICEKLVAHRNIEFMQARLLAFRPNANDDNSELLLKTILMEVCGN